MSYQPLDHAEDHEPVTCDCGAQYPYSRQLAVCNHPGCMTFICGECMKKCDYCREPFCSEHVEGSKYRMVLCGKCKRKEEEDEKNGDC